MEIGDQRPARLSSMSTRPPEPEHLPCPRCDSTNTKFCYYNNYNLSQPRHFCKACRRYWTRGGTLRNVPVGGGSRKSSSSIKRPRTNSAPSSTCISSNPTATTGASSPSDTTHESIHANSLSVVAHMGPGTGPMTGSLSGCEVNLNEAVPEAVNFSSLLTTQVGTGYLPFGGGFGLGPAPGLHGVGFGLGMMDWPMEGVEQGNGSVDMGGGGGGGGNGSEEASPGCSTWQIGNVEGGLADGDCFGWPDLAISMPGKGLK